MQDASINMKYLNMLKETYIKFICFVCAVVACFSPISAMEYRGTWADNETVLSRQNMFHFHFQASEHVVKAQRFCSDKSSNIAAFAISLHNPDSSSVVVAQLPYVVSSGDQKAASSGISTVLVKEMFLKSYDGLSPLDAEIQFIRFVREINNEDHENEDHELKELEQALVDRKRDMQEILAVPDLTFSSRTEDQTKDKLLGSILHCEQAIVAKSVLSKQFLANWIGSNFEACSFEEGSFLSFDIITYNDMCPKCFSTCSNVREKLKGSINVILQEKYPSKLKDPLSLKIFISSFRPYAVGGKEPHTRVCEACTSKKKVCSDYMIFHNHVPFEGYKVDVNAQILQFFNPWMTSYVTSFEVMDFIDAILKNKISIGDPGVSADHKSMLKCIKFSKTSGCVLGLSDAAKEKIEEYKAKLATTLKMVDSTMKSLQ